MERKGPFVTSISASWTIYLTPTMVLLLAGAMLSNGPALGEPSLSSGVAQGLSQVKTAKSSELVQASSREMEKQIVDKILGEGYDKRIRPAGSGPYNASKPGK